MLGTVVASLGVGVAASVMFVYDVITLPIYTILQKPWVRIKKAKKIRAKEVPGSVCRYRNYDDPIGFQVTMKREKLDTVEKIVRYAVKQHGDKKGFGTRAILSEENETQPNGKVFKKFVMGDYQWTSYVQFAARADAFGRALLAEGVKPGGRVCIFAETRQEWLEAAVGAFTQNVTVVTLYATLGEDAVAHGINETEVAHVITTHSLMPKVKTILSSCSKVSHVIYMEDQLEKTDTSGVKSGVKVIPFADMLKKGHDAKFEAHPPTSDDIAIIMYTSGSTGTPKGVMVSHYNMVSTMTGFAVALVPSPEDVYLGYLPLAHVLELMAELCAVMFGVPIGYSSPLTLMDKSSKIKRGCQGDCSVLRPTLMAAVPMILDRVAQGIKEQMHSAGRLAQGLFNWFVMYRNWWRRRGFSTPILHSLVFSRIAGLLGGRVRAMVSGGAPLSEVTHDLIRSCIGCSVMQGYGLTETTSCASLMDEYDVAVGRVGHPVSCCDVQLSDWEEGGYKVTDQPHPRGEIVVGGDNVTMGYFKQPEKTKEEFFESDGRRWFRTGDIGLIYPNGTIKIVDRKKDLVKLQAGEYVSLGRVETILSTSPFVDNMFVYGESSKNFVVAVVVANAKQLGLLAKEVLGSEAEGKSHEQLCKEERLEEEVQKRLVKQARHGRLEKAEIPARVALTSVSWSPDNNLVTAAYKLKRKELSNYYKDDLERLYK
ncbi:long-chain-fatty-acid--CoA ligase 4-like [Amphibalanus amphitrite]|uniref:long-chain-fatty-acid--CoA ligase 4-like n=1 Tax=Amphibalanus amphitrite TaxID=1232801 RepID=UPI001C91EBCF|nr:long-chain-fatty-acid--CoA ligase 4-like [Amphibalanus amphitrite]XP_043213779.1 long-chain-fatty-acid--CoA ligase 4-like [Amphibalanus amphitrite]XP_043213780.1 long-chain-fatty-acid--CoA ligase 4-like [Amphibalanus amphitrite]XP_043213782.1 long-chain-fatty-acid--CoA ligase 4-like [Amphibalanus amphitrite]XP_043213783.1 long-chain-fatty-acid--CoA ligase 4-like [Amphibalanus amphitrite]